MSGSTELALLLAMVAANVVGLVFLGVAVVKWRDERARERWARRATAVLLAVLVVNLVTILVLR